MVQSRVPRAGHHQLELGQLRARVRKLVDQVAAREEELRERSQEAERVAAEHQEEATRLREVTRLRKEVETVGRREEEHIYEEPPDVSCFSARS